MLSLVLLSLQAASALAAPTREAIDPVVKGTPQVLGIATDPALNRDSCGSVRFQSRDFWTCRDTQNLGEDGLPIIDIVSSTASWTEYNDDGSPHLEPYDGENEGLIMRGNNGINNKGNYFPLQSWQCSDNEAGMCPNNTRYTIWPDSPPLITSGREFGIITAYTWIRNINSRPDFSTDIPDPSVSLYKITYDPLTAEDDELPQVTLVDGLFWPQDSIPYGVYGNIVRGGMAYLYGQASNGHVALARVPADSVKDRDRYEYWVDGKWTTTRPSKDDHAAIIPEVSAGGQGTYYYSEIWQSYVWIGQEAFSVSAEFFITTAPEPVGPWEKPKKFYSGEDGNAELAAYSLQAHPHMVPEGKNQIYLTYTKTDNVEGSELDIYTTPLILVEWE